MRASGAHPKLKFSSALLQPPHQNCSSFVRGSCFLPKNSRDTGEGAFPKHDMAAAPLDLLVEPARCERELWAEKSRYMRSYLTS